MSSPEIYDCEVCICIEEPERCPNFIAFAGAAIEYISNSTIGADVNPSATQVETNADNLDIG